MTVIKMNELSPTAMTAYNKYLRANLLAIDDIMVLRMPRRSVEGV